MVFRDHSLGIGMLIATGLVPFPSKYQQNYDMNTYISEHGKEAGFPRVLSA